MSLCPNTNGGQCRCQPQDGVMCPYGPTPNDWKPWKEAAAASARPLPPLPEPTVWTLSPYGVIRAYTAAQVNALILADRAASAPQAVRRLTKDEVTPLMQNDKQAMARSIQRKFCEVNGLRIVPLAPQDTGGK